MQAALMRFEKDAFLELAYAGFLLDVQVGYIVYIYIYIYIMYIFTLHVCHNITAIGVAPLHALTALCAFILLLLVVLESLQLRGWV